MKIEAVVLLRLSSQVSHSLQFEACCVGQEKRLGISRASSAPALCTLVLQNENVKVHWIDL